MGFALWIESFRIAFREMRRHRTRTILTMLGVIFGVAAIIAVVSISQGAKRSIQGQIANLGSNMIIILPGSTSQAGVRGGGGSSQTLTREDSDAIGRECSSVEYSAPVLRVVSQIISSYANWSAPIIGSTETYLPIRAWPLEAGRGLERRDIDSAAKVCLIGRTTTDQLFGSSDPIGQRIRVKGAVLTIIGVLTPKGPSPFGEDQDDTLVVPITTAISHFSGTDRPHAILVSAKSDEDIPIALEQIRTLLRQRHRLREAQDSDFDAKTQQDAAQAAETTSNIMTILLVCVAAISLLVGGIGIMNIMLVTVMERTREIGIRMALGASRAMIMRQFLIESVTLAGVGGLIGIGLGLAGSRFITRFTGWKGITSPALLVAPVIFAVTVGMIFGVLPARRAARLNPIESLRHE